MRLSPSSHSAMPGSKARGLTAFRLTSPHVTDLMPWPLQHDELAAFGLAAAKSPRCVEGRQEEAARARKALQAAMGPGAVVDAAAVCCFFHVITRAVDSTGHAHPTTSVFRVMKLLMRLKNLALDWALWLLGPIMPRR